MWLEAGILESGEWCETDRGTPQGAGISPLLANVFLHYVLDLWVQQWRCRRARGRVVIVRYADDFVMGFEKTDDARRMMAALTERLAKFGLAIHDEKTRLIEFGRLPALARRQRGLRRPETFAFLGFSGWTRDGRFIVKLKTQSKRLTRKLKALRQEAWRLMHVPLAVQHRWYTSVLLGHYGYYGRPQNFPALIAFRQGVLRIWLTCLRRRSQKTRLHELADLCGSADKLSPSNPSDHSSLDGSCSMTQVILGKSRVRGNLHARIREGESRMAELLDHSGHGPQDQVLYL
jgi:RNA-directed DNA polymerase